MHVRPVILLVSVAAILPMQAQQTGRIVGSVVDTSGAAVATVKNKLLRGGKSAVLTTEQPARDSLPSPPCGLTSMMS